MVDTLELLDRGARMVTCKIPGCDKKHFGRGYCSKHHMRWYRHGDPLHTELHGLSRTPEYDTWRGMMNRCHCPSYKQFKYYGGRGITVSEEWKSFINFYRDMGKRPFKNAQIDRIDNDKGYSKQNCQWLTPAENTRKSSQTKLTMSIANQIRREYVPRKVSTRKLGRKYGVCSTTISDIVNGRTWNAEDANTESQSHSMEMV